MDKSEELKLPAEVSAPLRKPVDERTAAELRAITRHYRTIDKQLVALDKAVKDHKAKAPPGQRDVKQPDAVGPPRPQLKGYKSTG